MCTPVTIVLYVLVLWTQLAYSLTSTPHFLIAHSLKLFLESCAVALDLGNRTLMMDQGRVIYDVTGEERARLTIQDLTDKFRQASGKALDNDRMLLGVQ